MYRFRSETELMKRANELRWVIDRLSRPDPSDLMCYSNMANSIITICDEIKELYQQDLHRSLPTEIPQDTDTAADAANSTQQEEHGG